MQVKRKGSIQAYQWHPGVTIEIIKGCNVIEEINYSDIYNFGTQLESLKDMKIGRLTWMNGGDQLYIDYLFDNDWVIVENGKVWKCSQEIFNQNFESI